MTCPGVSLQPYFRSTDYNYESAKKASGNVAGLCSWCKAMCTYHEVAKVVEPKIAALKASEAELKVRLFPAVTPSWLRKVVPSKNF